jgi:hypothetical protein
MKKVIVSGIVLFMYSFGIVIAIDLIMVLNGHVIPRDYPDYGMHWNDSTIFHYNVSRAANTLIGGISFMALFGGTMYLWLVLIPEIKAAKQRKLDRIARGKQLILNRLDKTLNK